MAVKDKVQKRFPLDLPDHIVLLCLARVPIASFGSVRQVCKAWHEMLRSRDFWNLRCDLGNAEKLLFVCTLVRRRQDKNNACKMVDLCHGFDPSSNTWFRRRQDKNNACNACKMVDVWHGFHPSSNTWFQLPDMPEDGRVAGSSAFATVDGKSFAIGGELEESGRPCVNVSYFDVRERCWRIAAPLNIARSNCMARVIGKRLYVFGGFSCDDAVPEKGRVATAIPVQTAEVYHPMTESWELVSNMTVPAQLDYGAVVNRKLLAIGTSGRRLLSLTLQRVVDWTATEGVIGTTYDPHTNEWTNMAHGLMRGWQKNTVEVNGRLYGAHCCLYLEYYDCSKDTWEHVMFRRDGHLDTTSPVTDLGWILQLVNFKEKVLVISLKRWKQRATMMLLDMEEHLSEDNCVKVFANVLSFKDISKKIRDAGDAGQHSRFQDFQSCQVIDL